MIPIFILVGMGPLLSFAVMDESATVVPSWIKNTASFWIEGKVSDDEYINSIKYLIENDILVIDAEKSIDDRGDFYITYMENPNTPFENSSKDWLISNQYLEVQRDFLNELFSLPYDVEILATECVDANMFYDWQLKQIILCYEFIDEVYVDFIDYYEITSDVSVSEDDIAIMTYDVIDFIFLP